VPHVYVSSGKGGKHRIVPLNPDGVEAWQAMIAHKAFGPFSASSARTSFRRACKAAGVDPDLYRPYDLRHRFATSLRAAGADLADVQALLGHRNISTTMRYAPVVAAKLVSAVNAIPRT
jgi:site-specific recombinase XerD